MRFASLPLVLLAAAGALVPVRVSAQTLRYAGSEGRRDRYRLTTTVKIHQDFQGTRTELTVKSYGVLGLTLERLRGDTLTYGVVFDSLDVALEGAPVPAPDLSCVVGRKMRLVLSRTGRVYGFEPPADLCAVPAGFDLESMVSHFFPRLSDGGDAGTSWSDTLDYPVSQGGIDTRVRVVTRYTSRGTRAQSDTTFVEVAYATETTVSGKGEQQGAPLLVDGSGTGSGTLFFDPSGRVFWSSSGTQTLELKVDVTPAGQPPLSIPVRQETTSRVQHL